VAESPGKREHGHAEKKQAPLIEDVTHRRAGLLVQAQ
jgi:hypothetical protein